MDVIVHKPQDNLTCMASFTVAKTSEKSFPHQEKVTLARKSCSKK